MVGRKSNEVTKECGIYHMIFFEVVLVVLKVRVCFYFCCQQNFLLSSTSVVTTPHTTQLTS